MIPAHAYYNRIVALFPGSSLAAVEAVGALRGLTTVEVPDTTQVGATLIDDVWTNPTPQDPTPPAPRRIISALEYVQRFTAVEEAAIRTRAKTDAVCEALLARTYDVRLSEVNLDHPDTVAGVAYLQSVGVLTVARVAQVLA